jgi:hypothetical protein
MQMCSDQMMVLSDKNRKFCTQLLDWTMQESGVLRAQNLRHVKKGEKVCSTLERDDCGPNPENYKIEDHVEFYINLEQKVKGKWYPYNAEDV